MEAQIAGAVEEALKALGAEGVSFVVERPVVRAHGDYTVNAALAAAKQLGKNPRELAGSLATTLRESLGVDVSNVEVAGPGFINITLAREVITDAVARIARGEALEKSSSERVIIDYTDPNPFKEMHIGHLMSNIIGEATAGLIESSGATVIRANYQGDVGPHVAKALWALRRAGITEPSTAKEIGEAYANGSRAYEEDERAKAEIDAINTAIYKGEDAELLELWRKGRDVSLQAFEQIYKVLGTKFDYYFFESETSEPGARIVRDGLAKGVFEESEGAVIYRGEKKGLHTLVFITGRGTPTYEAKDIGLAFLKEERVQSDRSIIVTAAEQIGHFKIVLAALEDIAPLVAAKTSHLPHGFLRLTTGKMSSREGNVITATGLIEDVVKKASEKSPNPLIAERVAVGAIKYMVLRQAPGSDIIFDPEKSLSLEGDSGPYLQYALVRAKSVLAQAGEKGAGEASPEPYAIERVLLHFASAVTRAREESSPNLLVSYLTELAGEWNSFYAAHRIIGGEHEAYKLGVARAFVVAMSRGLDILGIPTPEKM